MTTYFTPRFWLDTRRFNFDKRNLGGCNIEVLPFLRVFPPEWLGGYPGACWTIHFGWLLWTVGIHQRPLIQFAQRLTIAEPYFGRTLVGRQPVTLSAERPADSTENA